jgi:DNA-binding FrmR family transcriptional regulator
MLQKHLESCVMDAFQSNDKKVQEEKIRELTHLYKGKNVLYVGDEKHE